MEQDVHDAVKFALEKRAQRTRYFDDGDEEDIPGGTKSFEDAVREEYYKAIADENRFNTE